MEFADPGLQMSNCLAGVQVFGASFRAVHDSVAAEQLEAVVKEFEALLRGFIARIFNPTVCLKTKRPAATNEVLKANDATEVNSSNHSAYLHQHGRAEVFVWLPPVTGARGAAASAENALVHSVQTLAVLRSLQVLACGEVGGFVLFVSAIRGTALQFFSERKLESRDELYTPGSATA